SNRMNAKRLLPGSSTPTAGAIIGPCLIPARTWFSERPAAIGKGGPASDAAVEASLLLWLDPPQPGTSSRQASATAAASAARAGVRGIPRHSRVPVASAAPAGPGTPTTGGERDGMAERAAIVTGASSGIGLAIAR